jgi:hypothetical protein
LSAERDVIGLALGGDEVAVAQQGQVVEAEGIDEVCVAVLNVCW